MKICPHVIRTIEDWACTNAKNPFAPTPRKGGRNGSHTDNGATPGAESPMGKIDDNKERVKTPKTADSNDLAAHTGGPGPRAVT